MVAAAGSFAAVSTLLGSPLLGAFLLMEASGLGGAMLVPGLLAAGVGSLIFLGLDHLTGLGTFSLAIPGLPHVGSPTGAEFFWALAIGGMAADSGRSAGQCRDAPAAAANGRCRRKPAGGGPCLTPAATRGLQPQTRRPARTSEVSCADSEPGPVRRWRFSGELSWPRS